MVKEVYVSYETAKLLKEKGFSSDDCHTAYDEDKGFFWYGDYSKDRKGIVDAPTQAMAMKWLREVHHYYIQIMLDSWACEGHMGYYVVIQKTDSDFEMMLQDVVDEVFYQTYEEAAEAAIGYILNDLIKYGIQDIQI